jgi:hypothetical protein
MAAGPLNQIVQAAASVADDLGFIALADVPRHPDTATDYRVIDGLMVTAPAYRWDLWQTAPSTFRCAFRGA